MHQPVMHQGINPFPPVTHVPAEAKKVFQGILFSVWQWPQTLYDGSQTTFERIKRTDSVNVLGVLPDKKILLALDEQPHRPPLITLPGGRVEAGESPLEAAQRELLEETGFSAKQFIPWYSYQPSSSVLFTVHCLIARGLEKKGPATPDPGERIQPLFYAFEDFLTLGREPRLRDFMLRIYLLEACLSPEKKQALYTMIYD